MAKANKKIVPKWEKADLPVFKLCKKCSEKNNINNIECDYCESDKFLPEWVTDHKTITSGTSVDITKSSPQFGDVKKRVTLNKYVYGYGAQKFNIPNYEIWERIKKVIDDDFAVKLGWRKKGDIIEGIKAEVKEDKKNKREVKAIINDNPQFSNEFIKTIAQNIKVADHERIQEFAKYIFELGSTYDEVYLASIKQVFDNLKNENALTVASLADLLKEWNLKQINDVSREVKRRIKEIELFVEKIQDDKTLEIKGDNSIHRILERSMWLLDEKYWIIQSNKQLRTFIGKELAKEDKRFEKKRPDFACGSFSGQLVIIELKRPKHELTVNDLNQLEKYIILSKKYQDKKFSSYKGYLVGNSKSVKLEETLEFRKNIEILTFNDLIEDCKKRYNEFLRTLNKQL